LPQRDFAGPTLNVTYDWNPTGNFTLTALAVREISTTDEVMWASCRQGRHVAPDAQADGEDQDIGDP